MQVAPVIESTRELPPVVLSAHYAIPPANDAFADALTVTSLPFSAKAEVAYASTEAGEPQDSA